MSQAGLEQSDGARAPESPFAGARASDVEHDLNEAFTALIPLREVYEPEILQSLARRLPRPVAESNQAVLLEYREEGVYIVGMCEPTNVINVINVARALRVSSNKLAPRQVAPERLLKLQATAYGNTAVVRAGEEVEDEDFEDEGASRETVSWTRFDASAEEAFAEQSAAAEAEQDLGTGTGLRASAERIIIEAIRRRASDIHLVPGPDFGRVCFRIDGLLYTFIRNVPAARMENLRNALSDMAGVNGYELMHRGRGAEISITVRSSGGKRAKMTLRFHGRRGYYGAVIVIRIQHNAFRDFDVIGFEVNQNEEIQAGLDFRHGVILVTGATGSGKSNTLEAMLRKLEKVYNYRKHVLQIGNPIEFPNPLRTQLQVDDSESWADALKDALRMDPDIFSPGEFRDSDEAKVVFQAAATGHLTLTTLHTNNIAQTFSRLNFLEIERDKQSDLIRLVVSQELIPVLCPHCKRPDPDGRQIAERLLDVIFPNRDDLREAIRRARGRTPFFYAEGCELCHGTGVKGRTCVAEVLRVTPDIGLMLRGGVDGEKIVEYAIRHYGMTTLAEAAARKLTRGITSFDHVRHLLISTVKAAPENITREWDSAYDEDVQTEAAQYARRVEQEEKQTEDYIDAKIVYTEEAAEAAA